MRKRKKERDSYNGDIWLVVFCLCLFGIIMVFSASAYLCGVSAKYNYDSIHLLKRQVIYVGFGVLVCFVVQFFDYAILYPLAKIVYGIGIGIIFLLLTGMGASVNGATRWISVFGMQFQVAEVVKICVIVLDAYLIQRFKGYLDRQMLAVYLWVAGGVAAGFLKIISNDLSSSLVILGISFGISFIYTRTTKLHLAFLGIVSVVVLGYVGYMWFHLPTAGELSHMSFRVGRIAAWLAPQKYATNQSYQTVQALYAIGRGGWFGQGLGKSVQKFSAIPEAQNDMIFSIVCEELGLVGVGVLMFLFGYLLYFLIKTAVQARNLFGSVLTCGIVLHVAIQMVMNIAVNVNLLPNTGIALPFVSYGGTAVVCQLAEIGIILSVGRGVAGKKVVRVEGMGISE